jgi:predicted amidohydrolase YtcJ
MPVFVMLAARDQALMDTWQSTSPAAAPAQSAQSGARDTVGGVKCSTTVRWALEGRSFWSLTAIARAIEGSVAPSTDSTARHGRHDESGYQVTIHAIGDRANGSRSTSSNPC